MGLQYSNLFAGTKLKWTSSGGDKVLTFTSVADGSARQGDKSATLVDTTNGMPELLMIEPETKVQSAPTDGKEIELYFGWSDDTVQANNNPAGLGGADAALTSPDSAKLLLSYIMSIVCSNAIGTGIQRASPFFIRPVAICFSPVLVNHSGQTASATGTDTVLSVTPWYRKITS